MAGSLSRGRGPSFLPSNFLAGSDRPTICRVSLAIYPTENLLVGTAHPTPTRTFFFWWHSPPLLVFFDAVSSLQSVPAIHHDPKI